MSSNQVSYIQHEQVRVPAATNKLNLYTPAALKALKALKIYLLGVRLFCPFSNGEWRAQIFHRPD